MNWPEQVDPVTRRVHWSRALASWLIRSLLIRCNETRTIGARLVLNTSIPMRPLSAVHAGDREIQLANWGSVQFACCEQAVIRSRRG